MKRIFLLCLLMIVITGCGGIGSVIKARYPNSPTSEMKSSFNAADALYRSRHFAEADAKFEKIIAEFPYTELTDEARFRRGEIAFARKDYNLALKFYRESVSDIISPTLAPKSYFKGSLSLFYMNRASDATDEIKKIDRKSASAILRMRVDSLGVKSSRALGIAPNTAIVWHLRLLDDYADAQGAIPTGISPDELISENEALKDVHRFAGDNTVTTADIEALPMKEMKGKRSGGFAAYKEALVAHSLGDTKTAARKLKSFLNTYPKHENYGAARLLLGEMGGAIGEGAGISVGVILPLSGKYAVYGEATLHGIECAVGVHEPCVGPSGMKLVVRDSESSAGAAAAVDELAAENVVAIIGPLLSTNAADVTKRAQELKIPIISLSQREGIAEIGNYVFRNSISDSSEMTTLADYAVSKLKLKRFLIVYSTSSKKGSEYRGLFTDAVKSLGGSIVATKVIPPSKFIVDAGDELRGRGAAEAQKKREDEAPLEIAEGVGGFDAVFIPDGVSAASYFAKNIQGSTTQRFKLLGIARWDDQKLINRAGAPVEGAIFVDSFYKRAPDENVSAFVSRFNSAYGLEPTLLEAFGYDAMRLIINAVQAKGAARRDSVRDALARTTAFPGVAGKTAFEAEGNAQREMWVLTVKNGSIEPAR